MKKIFTLFLIIWNTILLFCQPGQMDKTFNTTGKVTTRIENFNVNTSALLIQDDGKILVSGTAVSATNARDFVIARYTSDGRIDSSFNQTGNRVIDFFGKNDFCYAMALQSDGKILMTGITTKPTSERKTIIVRLLEDGSFDDTFGTNGVYVNTFENREETPRVIHFQDDGKIIVSGSIDTNLATTVCAVFKYNQDGSPDTSFGDQGLAIAVVPESYNPAFGAVQHDGKIITGGFLLGNNTEIIMLRFSPQGIIDSTFGLNGIVWTKFIGEEHFAYSIFLQDDHKILMVDGITHSGKRDFCMLRYNENGSLDSTFGVYGKVVTPISSGSNTAHAVSIQEDQKILLAGFLGTTPKHDFAMARYNSDGSLDAEFGNGGKVITDFGNDDLAFTMAIQSDNKIVLSGHTIDNSGNNNFALARYLSGLEIVGITEPADEFMNINLYPNPAIRDAVLKYNLQKDQVITIRLYDLSGKLVQHFVENENRSIGDNEEKLLFNPNILPGNYFLQIDGINLKWTTSIILNLPD
ncbi:MAG TPA: T9SS type A sorting domain-containing protein [Saprospiraceae bacterium]|nr:T9SS type A sorting domain-containing protein [Saprospiraceae bacterium]